MSPSKKQPRNAVSFSQFRRLQMAAFRSIRLALLTETDPALDAVHLYAWALETALAEARYYDAICLARTLSEQQYGDARSYRLGAQLVALVKKVPFEDDGLDPVAKATEKFLQSEIQCGETNAVMRDYRQFYTGTNNKGLELADDAQCMHPLLHRARERIHKLLGNTPPLSKIYELCRFSGGSSVGVHGNLTHFQRKLTSESWTCSPAAIPFARAALKTAPFAWEALGFDPRSVQQLYAEPMAFYKACASVTPVPKTPPLTPKVLWGSSVELSAAFNRAFDMRVEAKDYDLIAFVSKEADCDRTVGTQPLLNMYLQLGFGDYIARDILRDKCGIDITTAQEEVNGPLALLGSSCEGHPFATIDLRSASDCISIELARFLLPPGWFEVLNAIRTPAYQMPGGSSTRYQKFCAMGNGFCFPLETLIFWSLARAVYDEVAVPTYDLAVYGDDIIVYQSAALLLIELLNVCGFDTNISKTFVFGPFRESCGQDFFNGINVRPVVVDEVFTHDSQVYHFINSLQRKGYSSLAKQLRAMCPADRLVRPYAGDTKTALEVPFDEFMASRHARWMRPSRDESVPFYSCWSWVEFLEQSVMDETVYPEWSQIWAVLYGAEPDASGLPRYAKRRETRTRVRRVAHG